MDECFRCGRKEDKVKLLDAVYEKEIAKICEECSVFENVPIIRKPTSSQIEESQKSYSIGERMRRMRANSKQEPEKFNPVSISLDKLRKPKDYKSLLDSKFKKAKENNQPLNLVDNYNWHILMTRKKRKIDRKQLANAIGESEEVIRMIEEKFLPDDALRIIAKIEQYLGIKIRTGGEEVKITQKKILRFDPETTKKITIDDLRRMKEARENSKEDVSSFAWGKKEKEDLIGADIDMDES